ncbi:hypothetical protein FVE85_9450 [Porphyridium purpureum]|uniref:Transmembrane protein n=1 Tax=Porphyridium purpureum TaxID=35688 RepID=A0A5J4YJ29_PORPP|nr:hypothetical protein FVE85_9450 [Porphyridium purpureum]|eukprot:POR3145..scf261_15
MLLRNAARTARMAFLHFAGVLVAVWVMWICISIAADAEPLPPDAFDVDHDHHALRTSGPQRPRFSMPFPVRIQWVLSASETELHRTSRLQEQVASVLRMALPHWRALCAMPGDFDREEDDQPGTKYTSGTGFRETHVEITPEFQVDIIVVPGQLRKSRTAESKQGIGLLAERFFDAARGLIAVDGYVFDDAPDSIGALWRERLRSLTNVSRVNDHSARGHVVPTITFMDLSVASDSNYCYNMGLNQSAAAFIAGPASVFVDLRAGPCMPVRDLSWSGSLAPPSLQGSRQDSRTSIAVWSVHILRSALFPASLFCDDDVSTSSRVHLVSVSENRAPHAVEGHHVACDARISGLCLNARMAHDFFRLLVPDRAELSVDLRSYPVTSAIVDSLSEPVPTLSRSRALWDYKQVFLKEYTDGKSLEPDKNSVRQKKQPSELVIHIVESDLIEDSTTGSMGYAAYDSDQTSGSRTMLLVNLKGSSTFAFLVSFASGLLPATEGPYGNHIVGFGMAPFALSCGGCSDQLASFADYVVHVDIAMRAWSCVRMVDAFARELEEVSHKYYWLDSENTPFWSWREQSARSLNGLLQHHAIGYINLRARLEGRLRDLRAELSTYNEAIILFEKALSHFDAEPEKILSFRKNKTPPFLGWVLGLILGSAIVFASLALFLQRKVMRSSDETPASIIRQTSLEAKKGLVRFQKLKVSGGPSNGVRKVDAQRQNYLYSQF